MAFILMKAVGRAAVIHHAELLIHKGLGLEGGMEKTLAQAQQNGVKTFTARILAMKEKPSWG
jgi:ABC-type Zn uptake system ZnuABC Zn-binding protein ZnuA